MKRIVKHTCDGNGPFPCDERCYKCVRDDELTEAQKELTHIMSCNRKGCTRCNQS